MPLSRLILTLLPAVCLYQLSCHRPAVSISFYYWRTSFHLDSLEKQTIQHNGVTVLYTRYFDIDLVPGDSMPRPIAPISLPTGISTAIVPVVYIKNRVFEHLDSTAVNKLVNHVNELVTDINRSAALMTHEIQFDCDWTEHTSHAYFNFLKRYKAVYQQIISATIRLHQVKYPGRTGIPPVDYGVLMYYNMGNITADDQRSIYDRSIAEKYSPAIKNYPLVLDIGLPIFSWGLQLREGRVVKLLNKMNFLSFKNDTNFTSTGYGRYHVNQACFHGGYYFRENDLVKTEHVPEADLLDIIDQVNRYSNHRIRNLIFYDLDKENLALYEANTFRKIMVHVD